MKRSFRFFVFAFIVFTQQTWAVPKHERTMIPFPPNLEAADVDMLKAMLQLELYPDSEDPNLLHYVPPVRVEQFAKGAGSMLLHVDQIKNHAEAKGFVDKRNKEISEYYSTRITELERRVASGEEKVRLEQVRLDDMINRGSSPDVIEIQKGMLIRAEEMLDLNLGFLKKAQSNMDNEIPPPEGFGRTYLDSAVTRLALAGLIVNPAGFAVADLLKEIDRGLLEVSNSYGGYLGLNAYGGFTAKQFEALKAFKAKYAPEFKIALLPVENMTFYSLTETGMPTSFASADKPRFTNIFRAIRGSGDYTGATIVLDATVAGAAAFANHLSPFILPVGIKATLKRRTTATHAKLDCDFSSGFVVNGRHEVRPQFLIFGREVINEVSAADSSSGGCKLEMLGGDPSTAEYRAMQELDMALTNMQMQRTSLSHREKEAYYAKVMHDAQANPQKTNYIYQLARGFQNYGYAGLLIEALAGASDAFWQVSEQDVENFSRVRFHKEILIQPDEVIPKYLSAKLCLVYNSNNHAYDRCTELEEVDAQSMTKAVAAAQNSPECAGKVDPFACGESRDQVGRTAGKDRTYGPDSDNKFAGQI